MVIDALVVFIGRSANITYNGLQINAVKDMKRQILEIADDLSNDAITVEQAQSLLLRLFGVNKSFAEGVKVQIMTKDELIAKQQLEIEDYKQMLEENSKLIQDLKMRFYAIGQPLNDNVLMFNKEQLLWCFRTVELVEQLNGL